MTKRYDDETLMAFADGRLEEDLSTEIEAALAVDPALASRVEAFVVSKTAARDLFAPLGELPVPPSLEARVRAMAAAPPAAASNVVRLPAPRAGRAVWPAALAASLAALVFGPLGYFAGSRGGSGETTIVSVPPDVVRALDSAASGTEMTLPDGRLKLIATFRGVQGALCREFEVDRDAALVAVACRDGAAWRTAFAVTAPLEDGYAPASSMTALDAWLEAVSAGAPLSVDEEKAALAELEKSHEDRE